MTGFDTCMVRFTVAMHQKLALDLGDHIQEERHLRLSSATSSLITVPDLNRYINRTSLFMPNPFQPTVILLIIHKTGFEPVF